MSKLAIFLTFVLLLPFLCKSFSPESPTDRKVLVLLDDLAIKSSHSLYFKSLQSRGFQLEFKLADDPKIALQRYGQYLYDALILFSPTIERFGGSIDQAAILDFVDSGHDLVLAADVKASDLIREIATECGVDFDEDPAAVVIDHTSYAVSNFEGDHTLIASDDFIKSDVILGKATIEAPVIFQGISHTLNPANYLVLKALSSSPSAYSANPKSKLSSPPSQIGSSISLVSIIQARNNARILISGSLSLFSNRDGLEIPYMHQPPGHADSIFEKEIYSILKQFKNRETQKDNHPLRLGLLTLEFFKSRVQKAGSQNEYVKSGNEQFVTELSKWIFHERGHLKAVNVKHNKLGEVNKPAIYRINDDLEYSVEIYEWSGITWEPYVADDVQLQFYMMSPYVLKNLSTNKKGQYFTTFKVPDVYGVFQFKVEYQRLGYTSLTLSNQIPVRPFRHNEYERFIPAAYPYYGATFSMMAGFFVFTFVHLYNK